MKKMLLLSAALMIVLPSFGQDQAVGPKTRKKFKIGFQLSPSVDFFQPNTKGVDLDKAKVKFGYGIAAEVAFTSNYALVFGLEHKMAGASLDFQADADARYISQSDKLEYRLVTRTYRYDYVNLPITLKLMTNEIGYFTYFGQFGVDLSVLASARAQDQRQLVTFSTDTSGTVAETFAATSKEDLKGIYKNSSFANVKLRIGAGFEWSFSGNTSLVVSVSYHNGFIDLMRNSNNDRINNNEGLFKWSDATSARTKTPFELNANLHQVALNVGILF